MLYTPKAHSMRIQFAIVASSLLLSTATIVCLGGCAGSTAARPSDVPEVDMSGATRIDQGSEVYWQHAPTEADAAALLDKTPITTKWATLYVNGLGCPQCASNIDLTLAKVRGVSWMYVDLGHGVVQMQLQGDAGKPSPIELKNKVADAGFTLVKIRTH
jgi:copper chaperone CopZ